MRFLKGATNQLSHNFLAREFDCPCHHCIETEIDLDLVAKLQALRDLIGCSIKIDSGYRCPEHQLDLERQGYETAKNSQHLLGKAADIQTGNHTGLALEVLCRSVGFKAVGVAATWVHVDLRGPKERRWTYSKR